MREDGTYKCIQNIAGWTARHEVHIRMNPVIKPNEFRPKAINYQIDLDVQWNGFLDPYIKRRLFAIDCSYSVSRIDLYFIELLNDIKDQ